MNDVADMAELLSALYASLSTGDASAWEESFASDVLVIGTDDAEWWQGKGDALRVIDAQITELHDAGARYAGGTPQIGSAGDTVWAADRPTLRLADGTTVPLRVTAVATRDGDTLAIRQMHVSVGAPNEETLQQDLTL
jgi:ketosteroid isomerase-like protein